MSATPSAVGASLRSLGLEDVRTLTRVRLSIMAISSTATDPASQKIFSVRKAWLPRRKYMRGLKDAAQSCLCATLDNANEPACACASRVVVKLRPVYSHSAGHGVAVCQWFKRSCWATVEET